MSISNPHHDDTFLQRIREMVWTLQSELSMLASAYCIKFMGLQKTEYWAAYTWLQKYFHPFFPISVLQGCQHFCIPVYLLPPTLELCITQKAPIKQNLSEWTRTSYLFLVFWQKESCPNTIKPKKENCKSETYFNKDYEILFFVSRLFFKNF